MLANYYCRTLYQKFNYFGAWHPTNKIQLGDIGILKRYQFERMANLSDLGISFETLMYDNGGKLDFSSDKNMTIKVNTNASTVEEGGLGKGGMVLDVNFSAEKAILLKVEGTKIMTIANQLNLAEEIERRFNKPERGDTWEKNWVVVTEVIEGKEGTIIVSEGKEGQLSLKAQGEVEPANFHLASAAAKFDTVYQHSIGTTAIGREGISPLFKLKGISTSWWSKHGRLKTKGLGVDREPVQIEPLGKALGDELPSLAIRVPKTGFSGKNIHVLSIGIDKYQSPEIPELGECVNDTKRLEAILKSNLGIPDPQYKILQNEEATRAGIIKTFRNHFAHLKEGDTAILHYSGHGSQEPASQAFIDEKLEVPYGSNEVIVCHDSRQAGIYNLADKELRWLIHELQYPKNEPARHIHFVALFDCCHSGSMLRQSGRQIKTRLDKFVYKARPIDAFLEGQYARLLEKGELHLPPVHYISLTACSPEQLAIEVAEEGGLFTTALCQILGAGHWGGRLPTYSEMHALIRDQVAHNSYNRQIPQFEYHGQVNPNRCFFQMGSPGTARYPLLTRRGEDWVAGIGAIHGLDSNAVKGLEVPIYTLENTATPYTWAIALGVEVEFTKIRIKRGAKPLVPNSPYLIGLFAPALPVAILSKSDQALQQLKKVWSQDRFQRQFIPAQESSYQLEIQDRSYAIYRTRNGKKQLVYGIAAVDEKGAQLLLENLEQIARWEQINGLNTPKNSAISTRDIAWSFDYQDIEMGWVTKKWDDEDPAGESVEQIAIPFDASKGGIPYRIEVSVKKTTRIKPYFYLIYLDRKYQISQKHEAYVKPIYPGESIQLYDSRSKQTGLGFLEKDVEEIMETYLLIASEEPLISPALLEQDGLGPAFGKINSLRETKLPANSREIRLKQNQARWMVKRLEVRVQKQ